MDGRVAGEEGAQPSDGGEGLIVEAQHVDDEALVEVYAGGVDGTAVEGLEGSALEVAPDGLSLVELPRLGFARVECGGLFQHSLLGSPSATGSPCRWYGRRCPGALNRATIRIAANRDAGQARLEPGPCVN